MEVFYDALAPFGRWVESLEFGMIWIPRVQRDWHPYAAGHWVWTNYGWTWVAEEEWGWATSHYGRWTWQHRWGWAWVPDLTWGPAWVTWRHGGDHIGWAPLPPAARWEHGAGLGLPNHRIEEYLQPEQWVFVEERHFTDQRLRERVLDPSRNRKALGFTRNVTNFKEIDKRVINRSVTVEEIEHYSGQRVPRRQVVEQNERPGIRESNDELQVFRPGGSPRVPRPADRTPPKREPEIRPTERPKEAEQPRHPWGTPSTAPAAPPAETKPSDSKPPATPKERPLAGSVRGIRLEERQILKRQADERRQLENRQRQELEQAQGKNLEALKARHASERAALAAKHDKERKEGREKRSAPPPEEKPREERR